MLTWNPILTQIHHIFWCSTESYGKEEGFSFSFFLSLFFLCDDGNCCFQSGSVSQLGIFRKCLRLKTLSFWLPWISFWKAKTTNLCANTLHFGVLSSRLMAWSMAAWYSNNKLKNRTMTTHLSYLLHSCNYLQPEAWRHLQTLATRTAKVLFGFSCGKTSFRYMLGSWNSF